MAQQCFARAVTAAAARGGRGGSAAGRGLCAGDEPPALEDQQRAGK